MIPIACANCCSHIFDLDEDKFRIPLTGAMLKASGLAKQFDGDWQYPQGEINYDWFCPICWSFPWPHANDRISSVVMVADLDDREEAKCHPALLSELYEIAQTQLLQKQQQQSQQKVGDENHEKAEQPKAKRQGRPKGKQRKGHVK